MKLVDKSLSLAVVIFAMPALAEVEVNDSRVAVFNFGGFIAPVCKVNGTGAAGANGIVIDQSNTSADIGTVELWCNTSTNATTEYRSANNGFLVDGNNKISYTLNVGDSASDVDLSSVYTDSNTGISTDVGGVGKVQALQITPRSNGMELAGQYSDTITVTVSYN